MKHAYLAAFSIRRIMSEDYRAYYLSYDINFILPRAHTLISLMSYYEEEQGSELSGIRLNRVPPERHRERSLAAGGRKKKVKAKYGAFSFNETSNNFRSKLINLKSQYFDIKIYSLNIFRFFLPHINLLRKKSRNNLHTIHTHTHTHRQQRL